ncbi:MAG: hypothetical protein QXU18_09145 [Thermoplasmatales archaeon]
MEGGEAMNAEFEDWMYENFKPKTIQNTLRSLRHLVARSVDLDERRTFRKWMIEEKKKGTLDRTLNTYIKAYNRYLTFRKDTKIKMYRVIRSPYRPVAEMDDYDALVKAAKTFPYTSERKTLEIEILFKTGLRLNELLTMTTDDILGDILKVMERTRMKPVFFFQHPSGKHSGNTCRSGGQGVRTACWFPGRENP